MREPTAAPRHVTKQRYVYESLREALIECKLRPGERLVIDDLARRFDTSIIPVREALRLLESEGLVVNVAHVGATVAPISRDSIVEVFTIMEGLETVSTRVSAAKASPADVDTLAELVALMDSAVEASQLDVWADLNRRFHLTMSEIAAMPTLHQMLERALNHWDRIRRFFFAGVLVHRAPIAQREHHEILSALQHRDVAALEHAVRQHIQGALTAYTEYLETAPSDR